MSGWAEELISVLLSKGISASADTGSGYFSALEVQTILNLLEIIDNPLQDIPLAAVMHSPIGHFSSEELAIIRAEEPPSQCKHLYDAATSFAQKYSDPAMQKKRKAITSWQADFAHFLISLRHTEERADIFCFVSFLSMC